MNGSGMGIQQLSDPERKSVDRAALRLPYGGADVQGLCDRANVVGTSLDHLIGTWTDREVVEMSHALEYLSKIDESIWK